MEKCIIVAIADNNAIGRDNALLWHISEDLKFFKRTTSGCPVIMGRKTFESIGRPLPKRTNIVVSRGFDAPEGVVVVPSLEEAYKVAFAVLSSSSAALSSSSAVMSSEVETSPSRSFIIGGGQIYAQAIQDADRLIVTHVHTVIEDADTFFPEIDPSVWKVDGRSELFHDEETGYGFEFVEYVRL
jgi:dihydrofolate reductase